MKSIVVFNQKGGVGKTSTVSNLMAEFYSQGYKVLAVDLDPQGNLTRFLNVRTQNENTIRELLLEEASFDETVKTTKYGDLVPSDEALQEELLRFASMPAFVVRIKKILEKVQGYDIILMDCPPTVNQVTASALVAGDYALIPTEAEYFSADGVSKITTILKQVKELNENLKVLGILLVKYNGRRSLTSAIEDVLQKASKTEFNSKIFDTRIRFTVDVPSSQAMHQSVKDYKASSKVSEDYYNLSQEIIKEIF